MPGGEHTAQAFQGLTFGGNNSGIGIGLGMLQQAAAGRPDAGLPAPGAPPPAPQDPRSSMRSACAPALTLLSGSVQSLESCHIMRHHEAIKLEVSTRSALYLHVLASAEDSVQN